MTAIYAASHHTDSSRDGKVQARTNLAGAAPGWLRSRKTPWAGRIMSAAAALFLLFDATVKVLQLPLAVEATAQLGYPASVIFGLGLLQLACLVVYLVPRTSVLGAVLWTGYLGGAVATHVRVGNPLFSNVLFPIYIAALLWGGLWLRDERLRAVLPVRIAE
jgi:hypothetical protein